MYIIHYFLHLKRIKHNLIIKERFKQEQCEGEKNNDFESLQPSPGVYIFVYIYSLAMKFVQKVTNLNSRNRFTDLAKNTKEMSNNSTKVQPSISFSYFKTTERI